MRDDKVREAVGVFHDELSLRDAADELMLAGFDRSALSLMASEHAVEERLGHQYDKVAEVEDDAAVPRMAYVGTDSRTEAKAALTGGLAYIGAVGALGAVVASGGTAAALVAGTAAAAGAGGAIGAMLSRALERQHAEHLQTQLEHGGLLLWVVVETPDEERKAEAILKRCGGEHVHVHALPAAHYAIEGGLSFDLSFMKRLGM